MPDFSLLVQLEVIYNRHLSLLLCVLLCTLRLALIGFQIRSLIPLRKCLAQLAYNKRGTLDPNPRSGWDP